MKVPAWFKKSEKPPTAVELEAKVAEAEAAHAAALRRVDEARQAFAVERSAAAQEALRTAKADADDVLEMLEVTKADHADAVSREAAAEKLRLRQALTALEARTTREAVRRTAQAEAEREADLIMELAACKARRRKLRSDLKALESERDGIARQLGQSVRTPGPSDITEADEACSSITVIELLASKAAEADELTRAFAVALKPDHRSYWPTAGSRFD